MGYVLIAVTNGDDLIPSKRIVVATSQERPHLEELQAKRLEERTAYLEKWGDQIPWWAECSLIREELIEEVVTV